jgi:hypothetical protein
MKDIGLYAILIGGWIVLPLLIVLGVNGFFKRIPREEKEQDRFSIRPVPAPKKQSFAFCPWCLSQIELIKVKRQGFRCPVCACGFQHHLIKWAIGLPLTVVLCILLPKTAHSMHILEFVPPVVWMFAGLALSFATVRHIPDFKIVEPGADPPPEPAQTEAFTQTEEFNASQHISIHKPKQLAAALTIIAAATAFVLLICWLISLAMK